MHPFCVVLAADVYALPFVPAAPLILAAAHDLELLVGELETRILGDRQQLLGARRVLKLLLELRVLEVLEVHNAPSFARVLLY